MKKLYTLFALAALITLSAQQQYTSSGFCAKIYNNGCINDLTWQGKVPIIKGIMIAGGYHLAPGEKKHDTRFFQTHNYNGNAKFQKDGDKLTVTVDSLLSNQEKKNAARYEQTIVFEPTRIRIDQKITQKVPLNSDFFIFYSTLVFPGNIFGRGIRLGEDTFKVIPEVYTKSFSIGGNDIGISLPEGILFIKAKKRSSFSFMDARQWGGKDCDILVRPEALWKWKAITHPVGTVWEWEYILSFKPAAK